jgi:hypothetical protein
MNSAERLALNVTGERLKASSASLEPNWTSSLKVWPPTCTPKVTWVSLANPIDFPRSKTSP